MLKPSLNKSLNMWNCLRVSIYTTPKYRPQEFAGEEFYFATIEEFEIAIDMRVLTEVLTRRFKGIIVCDGWKPYARFTNRIQRCWAHLLRESKETAEKYEEAIPLHNMLKELYEILTEALENDPPPKVRKNLRKLAQKALRHWIGKEYSIEEVRKFIGKIKNGFDYWFTFIINPGVEPTNNRAERALRPHVVLRKIFGTLRNEKGTSIHERIMTTLATWGQRGLNSLQMLTEKLAS